MRHLNWPNSIFIHLGFTVFFFCFSIFAQSGPLEDQMKVLNQKIEIAQRRLIEEPDSKKYRRDLADELHRLAHLEESRQNFEKAIELHHQSLKHYILSGERTLSSWDDGIQHTFEHLFMAHYDQAKLEQAANRHGSAHRWYKAAFELFVSYPGIFRETNKLGRVRMRVQEFEAKASNSLKRYIYQVLGDSSPYPLSTYTTFVHARLQCIEIF